MRVTAAPWLLAALLVLPGAGASSSFRGLHKRHRGANDGVDYSLAEAGASSSSGIRSTNSLAEVIELLGTMMKEFSDAAGEDKDNWEEYSEWSDEAEQDKNDFILKQKALVMTLTSKMNANKQLVAKLTEDLRDLVKDIKETKASIKDLIQMRKEEHATFEGSLADVTKTISAVGKATEILEGHYAASASALVEIRKRVQLALTMYNIHRSSKDMEALSSLLQDGRPLPSFVQEGRRGPDWMNTDGDKYNSYEKQGGGKGVLGMLDDLRSQLESQKQELISGESDSERQYDETKTSKNAELKNSENQQTEKTQKKATAAALIETCNTGIDEANTAVGEGQTYLSELLAARTKFQEQKDERLQTRSEEQAATQAALDALQAVSAGNTAFLQVASVSVSVAQASNQQAAAVARKVRVQNVLRKLLPIVKKDKKSVALVQLVNKLLQDFDAGAFGPVVKLLNDLVTRLESEQSAETTQHEWCETEKDLSVKAREEREVEIKNLKSTIESLTTQIAQFKSELLFLMSEIKRVEDETKTAKSIRKSEHELYETSKADHEEVINAIKTALGALGGQYGFLQLHAVQGAAAVHKAQKGKDSPFSDYASGSSSAGSATEMLEDLESRYSTALAGLIKDENDSQTAHDELLNTNKLFVETTDAEKNAKMKERRAALQDLADDKEEMKTNLLELHEVSKYLQDLRPSCDDIRTTYEERKKRREAEIDALKEALEVISDPTAMGF